MKKSILSFILGGICVVYGITLAATSSEEALADAIANAAWGIMERVEIMKVGGSLNYKNLKRIYQSESFSEQNKVNIIRVLENRDMSWDDKAVIKPSYPIQKANDKTLQTLILQKIGKKIDEYESLKVGGSLNYANMQRVYASARFRQEQKEFLEGVNVEID